MIRLQVAVAAITLCLPMAASAQVSDLTYMYMFEKKCAMCHGAANSVERAVTRDALADYTPERVYKALTTGPMAPMVIGLSDADLRGLAVQTAGSPFGTAADRSAAAMSNRCSIAKGRGKRMGDPSAGPSWNGMSPDTASTRFQPAEAAGLTAEQVPKLRRKWAFGFPDGTQIRAQPTVAGGRVFIGSDAGTLYALDAKTGCVHWSYDAGDGVLSAITVATRPAPPASSASASSGPGSKDRFVAYFGDHRATVHAVDAETGEALWKFRADDHPAAKITGSVVMDTQGGRLIVPVGSFEETFPATKSYECCTSQGSLLALDPDTGEKIWKTYAIPNRPKPVRKTAIGTQLYGPSGAGIWVAPTLDYKRGLAYVGTANSYIDVPDSGSSDAIIAFDLETGERRWSTQLLARDWNCVEDPETDELGRSNCGDPRVAGESAGANDDVSGSPILSTLPSGRQILIAGQESGRITALDPDDDGAVLWVKTTHDAPQWPNGSGLGAATDGELYYRGIAMCPTLTPDSNTSCKPAETGAMVALNAATGEEVWSTAHAKPTDCGDPESTSCSGGIFGATTVIPGVVFAGARDGTLRAYSTQDGEVLWEYKTMQEYETVNGVRAKGGSIGGHGPTIVDGMLFMGSGYNLFQTAAGNVLLAFEVE